MIETTLSPSKKFRARKPSEVVYPASDGKPLAETGIHVEAIIALFMLLRAHFKNRDDILIGSNNFFYYMEGNTKHRFAPDLYVVIGVNSAPRRVYKMWQEKVAPSAIFEISSRKTRREDIGRKKDLCASLGVREYYLFDPENDYLKPPFQGFELIRGAYRPMRPQNDGTLLSGCLGLKLKDVNGRIAIYDAKTGAKVLGPAEERDQAVAARDRAEAENARMREEIKRLKGEKK
jgi:Uma2 family endonuclease